MPLRPLLKCFGGSQDAPHQHPQLPMHHQLSPASSVLQASVARRRPRAPAPSPRPRGGWHAQLRRVRAPRADPGVGVGGGGRGRSSRERAHGGGRHSNVPRPRRASAESVAEAAAAAAAALAAAPSAGVSRPRAEARRASPPRSDRVRVCVQHPPARGSRTQPAPGGRRAREACCCRAGERARTLAAP